MGKKEKRRLRARQNKEMKELETKLQNFDIVAVTSEKEEENSTNVYAPTTLQIDQSSQFHEIDPIIQSENTSQSAESKLMKDDLEKTSYIDSSQSADLMMEN